MSDSAVNSLFVYGSLLDRGQRIRIIGRDAAIREAVLSGYLRRRSRFFYVVAKAGSCVAGGLILDLKSDEIGRLDRYEEVPVLYTREIADVIDSNSKHHRCWVYLPTLALIKPW
jgi:gamma-glutamylcyclotransferase (GGCT)/AIG2-like uncharacterized protein YtfP